MLISQHLYKTVKELDEKKADKKAVKSGKKDIVSVLNCNTLSNTKSIQCHFQWLKLFSHIQTADMQALETRVLVCEATTERLNRILQDVPNITEYEENCNKAIEKISRELDCKVNRTHL